MWWTFLRTCLCHSFDWKGSIVHQLGYLTWRQYIWIRYLTFLSLYGQSLCNVLCACALVEQFWLVIRVQVQDHASCVVSYLFLLMLFPFIQHVINADDGFIQELNLTCLVKKVRLVFCVRICYQLTNCFCFLTEFHVSSYGFILNILWNMH